MSTEFSSFEDALKKLELEEEDLKRLISAGEIRAFREGSKMHLRAEDVTKVAAQLGIGSQVRESGESLVVEDLSLGGGGEEGMSTTQLSEEDTLLDDVETVDVDDEAESASAAAGVRRTRTSAEPEVQKESTGMLAAAVLTAVLLVFAIPFAIGMLEARSTGLTSGVVGMFAGDK
ncbi:MAG: hypothetical protein O3A20_02270 [Planctomycetota bacterium]|nr:hypothetical protein [Planctomycetota bacterium]